MSKAKLTYFPQVKFKETKFLFEVSTNIRLFNQAKKLWYTQLIVQGGDKKYEEVDLLVKKLLLEAWAAYQANKDGKFNPYLQMNGYYIFEPDDCQTSEGIRILQTN